MSAKLSQLIVKEKESLRRAMELININASQICFVVDEDGRLAGSVSDGDIRRALLAGAGMQTEISTFMNRSPHFLNEKLSVDEVVKKMKLWSVKHIPVVDNNKRLVDVEIFDLIAGIMTRENRVVVMAGGKGMRLRPLTEKTPKPMLPIAGVPILERIIGRFRDSGFKKFTLCVNYLGDQIIEYFGDGKSLGVNIEYIVETAPMGTCGSLAKLKNKISEPFFVINGDILTSANFSEILDFHTYHKSDATMCLREFVVDISYGTVQYSGSDIMSISEKPREIFNINTGIYVLSPETLALISNDEYKDMPDFFNNLKAKNKSTKAFILKDFWLDIGRIEDYYKAQIAIGDVFGIKKYE